MAAELQKKQKASGVQSFSAVSQTRRRPPAAVDVTASIQATKKAASPEFDRIASNDEASNEASSHEFEGFYRTLKVDFNWFNKELSVGCSKLGELGTTSFKVNNDGGIEAEISPSIMFNQFTLGHLLVESQLGFKIAAKVHIYKDPKPLGEEIIASILIVAVVIVGAILSKA